MNSSATRPLSEIAAEISRDWHRPYFGAIPYLHAMEELQTVDDHYFLDDAKSIVMYFLANASTWKGETARRIKAELKTQIAMRSDMISAAESIGSHSDPSRRNRPKAGRGEI